MISGSAHQPHLTLPEQPIGVKTCTKCGVTKPLSDFHQAGYGKYQSRCKPCRRKINALDWHAKGYAKVRARRRKSKGYEW